MVITEEELRQAWQNGKGRIPDFPPGTRFTPAALDFLKVYRPAPAPAAAPAPPSRPQAPDGERRELQAPPGQRLIYTAAEVPGLLAGGPAVLVVHPSVTITHAAQELLRKAGARVVPYVEKVEPDPPAAPGPGKGADPDLAQKVRNAVQARLGRPVDPALLDEVIRRVLAAL